MIEPDSYENRDDSDLNAKRMEAKTEDPIVNLIAGGLLGSVGGVGLGFSVSLAFTGWAVVAFLLAALPVEFWAWPWATSAVTASRSGSKRIFGDSGSDRTTSILRLRRMECSTIEG